eukprot:scaffold11777_cov99-Isochrysis_galbana.AAC.2
MAAQHGFARVRCGKVRQRAASGSAHPRVGLPLEQRPNAQHVEHCNECSQAATQQSNPAAPRRRQPEMV